MSHIRQGNHNRVASHIEIETQYQGASHENAETQAKIASHRVQENRRQVASQWCQENQTDRTYQLEPETHEHEVSLASQDNHWKLASHCVLETHCRAANL